MLRPIGEGAWAMAKTGSRLEMWSNSPLYKLLYARLTWLRSKQQLFDVYAFARAIGYSHEAVYRWLREGKMSPDAARAVVQASRRKLALRDLYPFVLS
jgi:hypothetical protein